MTLVYLRKYIFLLVLAKQMELLARDVRELITDDLFQELVKGRVGSGQLTEVDVLDVVGE